MIAVYILAGVLGLVLLHALFLFTLTLFVKNKDYVKTNKFYRAVFIFHCRLAKFLSRIKITVSGREKLDGINGRFLLVGNHVSNYDPFMTLIGLKMKDIVFISKPENFKVPFFGKIARRCCYFAIDRKDPKKAMTAINHAAELLKSGETNVGVYPEGTRSKSGELLPFHDGVFKIAKKADVPVVIVSIRGTENVHKNFPFKRTKVAVTVLEVIDQETVRNLSTHELAAITREKLSEKAA